jgi:hypothetical protein
MADIKNILKFFHGNDFKDTAWDSKTFSCCKLCKTTNSSGRKKHWANGLCRSCYRRLSITHRLYNDQWNEENHKKTNKPDAERKAYKYLNPETIIFDDTDISTLLERYEFKCAYCESNLQDYDHTLKNAFQIEYLITKDNKLELIPVCRSCNCSKKNLISIEKLKRWAYERGIIFPFQLRHPK